MEVPIFQPLVERAADNHRFVVNDSDRSIQLLPLNQNFGNPSTNVIHNEIEKNESDINQSDEIERKEDASVIDLNDTQGLESYEKQQLKGCASATVHSLSSPLYFSPDAKTSSILISTCALPTNPSILSVSLAPIENELSNVDSSSSINRSNLPSRAEFDLSSLDHFGPYPIKIVTFVEFDGHDATAMSDSDEVGGVNSQEHYSHQDIMIRFNLMDTMGRVLVLRLAYSATNGFTLISSSDYPEVEVHDFPLHTLLPPTPSSPLSSPRPVTSNSNDVHVSPYAVEWLSPHIVVFGRKPMIVCADLRTDKVLEWNTRTTSDSSFSKRKKSRRSTLGSVLSLIAGSGEEEDEEMAPVAALSSATGKSTLTGRENTCLFSLHTDGTVRLWYIKLQSSRFLNTLYPQSVRLVRVQRNSLATAMMEAQFHTVSFDDDEEDDSTDGSCNPPLPDSIEWAQEFDAVSMTSRLYAADARTFALAISVKTLSPPSSNTSPVSVLVLHGNLDSKSKEDMERNPDQCLVLTVPSIADSMTEMSFSPNKRCELHGLFSSNHGYKAIVARYPPSCMALLGRIPEITNLTLDKWAETQMQEVSYLSPQNFSSKSKNEDMKGKALENQLEAMDSYFMQRLFSPSFLGISGNRPLESCIRKAFFKIIPEYSSPALKTSGKFVIEAETLLAIREWARYDETKHLSIARHTRSRASATENPSESGTTSVYHAFSTPLKRSGTELDSNEKTGNDSSDKLALHHGRWKKLLWAIWKEHMSLLMPLSITTLSQGVLTSSSISANSLLVRTGVLSVVVAANDSQSDTNSYGENIQEFNMNASLLKLDSIAQSFYDSFIKDEESIRDLIALEETVNTIVSTASFVSAHPQTEFIKEIKRLGALGRDGKSEALSMASEIIYECCKNKGVDSVLSWASSIPNEFPSSIPFPIFDSKDEETKSVLVPDSETSTSLNISMHIKSSTAYVSQLYLESARSLSLSRCLLVCGLLGTGQKLNAVIESTMIKTIQLYLHTAAIEWVSNQLMEEEVVMSSISLMSPNRTIHTQPSTGTQTVLDIYISLASVCHPPICLRSTIESIFTTCSRFRVDSFPQSYSHSQVTNSVNSSLSIPPLAEFGLLKRWHQPRLGLRLLAPVIGIEATFPRQHVSSVCSELAKIKILASEALLVEANFLSKTGTLSDDRTLSLQERAASLYTEANQHYDNSFQIDGDADVDVDTVFYVLTKSVTDWSKCTAVPAGSSRGEDLDAMVLSELKNLIVSDPQVLDDDSLLYPILRLGQLTTCRTLILSWITTKYESSRNDTDIYMPFVADENPKNHIRLFFHKLRTVSHLLDRLALVERHTTDHKLMLECANDTITALNSELPKDMVYDMTESATLWSATFQHAMVISEWNKALSACRNNPFPLRRKAGLRRLVVGMVECGALDDLLQLANAPVGENCLQGGEADFGVEDAEKLSITSSIDQVDDFYEAAVSVLMEQAVEQTKRGPYGRVDGTDICDFRGCLYSLHASRGDWKRASEAMNDRYGSMINTVKSPIESSSISEDLSLSALACANSIKMVAEEQHRFLIGGKNNSTALGDENETKTISDDEENINQLRTCTSLEKRALLSTAWKTLAVGDEDGKSKSVPTMPTSIDAILRLARSGFYAQAIILAKKKFDGAPNGPKQFSQVISHILCDNLVPLSIALSRPTPCNAEEFDNDWESEYRSSSRPTMTQLLHAMTADENQIFPSFVGEQWRPVDNNICAKGKVAMELVRKLTTSYSNSSNTVAMDVAKKFLDLDNNRALLPIWLEDLLLGRVRIKSQTGRTLDKDGLFANSPQNIGTASDPSSLLRLYMKRGLYISACNIVTEILLGHDGGIGRKSTATKRIPEKGNIDFIPYATIDMLDEFIDLAVNEKSGANLDLQSKQNILEARNKMVKALGFHFQMLKISETGVQSARALIK